jgi:hypothetical protein
MSFVLTNTPAHFMYLMNSVFMPKLDKFVVSSLMTYLYNQRVRKIMKSICESCFNDCETISSMQSLVSVNSGLMKCHSWVMWYHYKESLWITVRWVMSWIGSPQRLWPLCTIFLCWLAIIGDLFRTSPRFQSLSLSYLRRITSMCRAKVVMRLSGLWKSC